MTNSQAEFGSDASGTPAKTGIAGDFHDLTTVLDIHRNLVRFEEKVTVLQVTTKSNSENIEDLTKSTFAIPYLERDVAQAKRDLTDLDTRHNRALHELEIKLEKGLNHLGIRLGQEITNLKDGEISELKHIASIVKGLGALAMAAIAGGVLVKFLWH